MEKVLLTAGNVYSFIDSFAPFSTQMDFDNSGLLAGSMSSPVTGILCALDLNMRVINEALCAGANLIVTHHPILFRGRKNLCEDDCEGAMLCALIRNNIGLIAAHTNYDIACGGVNDVLASVFGIRNVEKTGEDGLLRIGDIEPMKLSDLTQFAEEKLGDAVRSYGDAEKIISRIAVCGGSAGEYAEEAFAAGADAYLTGEMRYHDCITCAQNGYAVLEAGHDATEKPAVFAMAEKLRGFVNDRVNVTVSKTDIMSASKR